MLGLVCHMSGTELPLHRQQNCVLAKLLKSSLPYRTYLFKESRTDSVFISQTAFRSRGSCAGRMAARTANDSSDIRNCDGHHWLFCCTHGVSLSRNVSGWKNRDFFWLRVGNR